MPYWYCGGSAFGFWWIFPLLFGTLWLLLIATVVWRFRRGFWWQGGPDAASVLRERFARGEIDAEEFESRRRVLDVRS